MNYFELYEQLKDAKKQVPVGSIWEDKEGTYHVKAIIYKDLFNCNHFKPYIVYSFESNELGNHVGPHYCTVGDFIEGNTRIK